MREKAKDWIRLIVVIYIVIGYTFFRSPHPVYESAVIMAGLVCVLTLFTTIRDLR